MMNFCIIERFLIYQMVNGRPRVNEIYKEQSYHIHQNFNSTNIYIYSFVISFLSIIEILLFIAGEFWEPKHQKLLQQRRVAKTKSTRKVFHQKPATLSKNIRSILFWPGKHSRVSDNFILEYSPSFYSIECILLCKI